MALTKPPREAAVIQSDIDQTNARIERLTAAVERVQEAQQTLATRIADMEAAETTSGTYKGYRGADLDRHIRVTQEAHDFLAAGPQMVNIAGPMESAQYVPSFSGLSEGAESIIAGLLVPSQTCPTCHHTPQIDAAERRAGWRSAFLAINELDKAGDLLIELIEEQLAREKGEGPKVEYINLGGIMSRWDVPGAAQPTMYPNGATVLLTDWEAAAGVHSGRYVLKAGSQYETPTQQRRRERAEERERATTQRAQRAFDRTKRAAQESA